MARPAKRILLVAAAAAVVLGVPASTAGRERTAAPAKDFLWALDRHTVPPGAGGDLVWRGGAAGDGAIGVERHPAVYVVYWGRRWAKGFRIADTAGPPTTSRALQRYVAAFFAHVGGSAWAGIQTQYCRATRPGAASCADGSGFVANPQHQLKGVWIDPSAVPANVFALGPAPQTADDPIAREARRAAAHFGYRPDATYFVVAPPGLRVPDGPVWCGYHSQTAGPGGRIQYAFIPWLDHDWPGLGREGCGMHAVNRRSDAFGNGVFDAWSIVMGHEYAEAVVDPDNFDRIQDGWNDGRSTENGDKCAWRGLGNVVLGEHRFAVQPLWSNEAFDATGHGCVLSP